MLTPTVNENHSETKSSFRISNIQTLHSVETKFKSVKIIKKTTTLVLAYLVRLWCCR